MRLCYAKNTSIGSMFLNLITLLHFGFEQSLCFLFLISNLFPTCIILIHIIITSRVDKNCMVPNICHPVQFWLAILQFMK